MTSLQLTAMAKLVSLHVMRKNCPELARPARTGWMRTMKLAGSAIGMSAMLGGCVTVAAPDKPIVIELNINIKQEVVYRLADDAKQLIEQNAEIF